MFQAVPRGDTLHPYMTKGAKTLYEARRAKDGMTALPIASTPRALRLPMGFAIVVGAIIIAIAVAIYFFGYRAGFAAAENVGNEARQGLAQTTDPLLTDPTIGGRVPEIQQPRSKGVSDGGSGPQSPPASQVSLGPPHLGDPRQIGLNYFIIADAIAADRAGEMVAFCRGLGLDAVAISSHNARLQVNVLPGFGWDDRAGAPVKALEANIRAVGAKWKALGRGNGDFRDFYPKLFKG